MSLLYVLFSALLWSQEVTAHNNSAKAFDNPKALGGNLYFTFQGQPDTKPEPLNIIISAKSSFGNIKGSNDTQILLAQNGLSQYLSALNFSDECLGLHLSTPAYANVSSDRPELLDFLYRENFGDLEQGTCDESLNGGYHFRGWHQSTSGAWFLAASKELNLTLKHDLVPNGYDIGRDEVVRRALVGGKDALGCTWAPATLQNLTSLVHSDQGGSTGAYDHDIGIDGTISLLTIGSPLCPIDGISSTVGSTPRPKTSSVGTKTSGPTTATDSSASSGGTTHSSPSINSPADAALNSGSVSVSIFTASSALAALSLVCTAALSI